jgi:hypothetical protein
VSPTRRATNCGFGADAATVPERRIIAGAFVAVQQHYLMMEATALLSSARLALAPGLVFTRAVFLASAGLAPASAGGVGQPQAGTAGRG